MANMKEKLVLLISFLFPFYLSAEAIVEFEGDMYIKDSIETEEIEGSLFVEKNLVVGGNFSFPRLNFYPYESAAITMGENAEVASQKVGIALGMNSEVSANASIAIGYNAKVSGENSLSVGVGANTSGSSSFAAGCFARAMGDSAIAFGANSRSSGGSSVTLGSNTYASGDNSVASGAGSQSIGDSSFAGGVNSVAGADVSVAIGNAVESDSFCQITLGTFNEFFRSASHTEWRANDPLLVIGNGNENGRSNAIVVLKNGNTTINGTLVVTKPSSALPMGEFGAPESEAQ